MDFVFFAWPRTIGSMLPRQVIAASRNPMPPLLDDDEFPTDVTHIAGYHDAVQAIANRDVNSHFVTTFASNLRQHFRRIEGLCHLVRRWDKQIGDAETFFLNRDSRVLLQQLETVDNHELQKAIVSGWATQDFLRRTMNDLFAPNAVTRTAQGIAASRNPMPPLLHYVIPTDVTHIAGFHDAMQAIANRDVNSDFVTTFASNLRQHFRRIEGLCHLVKRWDEEMGDAETFFLSRSSRHLLHKLETVNNHELQKAIVSGWVTHDFLRRTMNDLFPNAVTLSQGSFVGRRLSFSHY